MRLWKKVSAMVAMAAVCMTMAVPVVASAETNMARNCPPHEYSGTLIREEVYRTETHEYLDITPNGDGTMTGVTKKCTIQHIKIYHYQQCQDCPMTVTLWNEETTRHMDCGQ